MAGSYDAIAARYAQEKGKYLDLLMDLQRQQREALGAIAEYAERMRTAGKEAVLAEAAVRSLQQAVAALKQIVTILETAKLFWEMMARACKGLANGRLREDIKLYMEDPKEERAAEWSRPEFKTQMLSLAAKWLALRLIAGDYQSAVAATRERVKETINRAPTIEEARILAPKLGEKLALDVKKDLEALDQANAELQQQRQQLAAA